MVHDLVGHLRAATGLLENILQVPRHQELQKLQGGFLTIGRVIH